MPGSAPRADGSHARVAIFIVNNRPETMEQIRPHVKVGLHRVRGALVSRAQRSMKRSGMMRCRPGIVTVRGDPGSALHRFADARAASRPGHAIASDAFGTLFTFQTAQIFSFPRRIFAPGVLHRCFTHPESRGGRSAEKRSGAAAPVGRIMTRYARRLRGALRPMTRDARLSALHRSNALPEIMK
jgi:hypothetical protein